MSALPAVTLVLGGAASGKSAYAESLALGTGLDPVYIATSEARDAEMAARIARHRNRRSDAWETVEAPLDLAEKLDERRTGEVLLVDCLTMWLGNHMLAGHDPASETRRLMDALAGREAPVVLVSNELGASVVPENALARRFRDEQGRLNQHIAREAGLVVAVIAGLPVSLKGRVPEGPA